MSCHLPDRRRDGDANRLEDLPTSAKAFAPYGERLASVFNLDLLQRLEISFDIGPLETVTGFLQPAIQLLPDDQCKKAAEDMTPDGFIQLMEDGAGIQNRLHVPEDLLYLPELLVLEGRLLRR